VDLCWFPTGDRLTTLDEVASGVDSYLVFRNGTLVATVNSTFYSDSALSPLTSYTYSVRSRDASGRQSDATTALLNSVTTSAAPSPLSVTILAPAPGAVLSGVVTLEATATSTSGSTPRIHMALVDDDLFGGSNQPLPYQRKLYTENLPNGPHTLRVYASDDQGASAVAEVTFTITNAPPAPDPVVELRAFPGAEGFGAGATGGRGGAVVYVTNTNESGPGSLNAALALTGPRYILFRASGLMNNAARITQGNLTWAGHTSPGGFIVRGVFAENRYNPAENRDNLILRHLRSRPNMQRDDALRVGYAKDVMIDHGSFTRANDEAAQIICTLRYSLQNSILAETIGPHFGLGGILVKYSTPEYPLDQVSVHHNLFTRLGGRFPQISHNEIAATGLWRDLNGHSFHFPFRIAVATNLYWDTWSAHTVGGSSTLPPYMLPEYTNYKINYEGNSVLFRPERISGFLNRADDKSHPLALYLSGNRMSTSQLTDYQLIGNNGVGRVEHPLDVATMGPIAVQAQRHPFPPTTPYTHDQLAPRAGRSCGAFPRDILDSRLTYYVATGTIDPSDPWGARLEASGSLTPTIREQANTGAGTNPYAQEVTDLLTGQRRHLAAGQLVDDAFLVSWSSPPPPPLDSDDDGMPDSWELHNGLDPLSANHNGKQLSLRYTGHDGYDNLECYLNRLSDHLTEGAPLTEGTAFAYPVGLSASVSPARFSPGVPTTITITAQPSSPDAVALIEVSAATLLSPYAAASPTATNITAQRSGNLWTHSLDVPATRDPGTYEILVHLRDTSGRDGYVLLPVVIARAQEPATYASWQAAHFTGTDLTNDAISGPLADPDAAGLTNFQRYAHNLPARGPVPTPVTQDTTSANGQTYLTLSFDRLANAPGLTYTVEASTDLITWSAVPGLSYTAGTPTRITAQDPVPLDATPRRFLRLCLTTL
jgi:hypothetical protein